MKWISVNDRLPQRPPDRVDEQGWCWSTTGTYCLVYDGKNVFAAHYTFMNKEFWVRDSLHPLKNITHWMEMPKPPKEKKPTDLTGKCGSCEYAKPTTEFGRNCYIFCSNFEDLKRNGTARYKQRTTKACKRYKAKENSNG